MTTAVLEKTNVAPLTDNRPTSLVVDDVRVNITYSSAHDLPVSTQEIRAYIERGNRQNLNSVVSGLNLAVQGEDIEIKYELAPVPFDRIRRITGYLVGTMDRWNDAKMAEEHDRVKHEIPTAC